MGKPFSDQDLPNIPSADREHPAKSSVVATVRPLLARLTGACHPRQAGIAGRNKVTKALGSLVGEPTLVVTARLVAALWGVETNEAIRPPVPAYSVAVDHLNRRT
jgi:hypothetical protein